MFKKKKRHEPEEPEEEFDTVNDESVDLDDLSGGDNAEDVLTALSLSQADMSESEDSKTLRAKYSKVSRLFHKHLIYVRMVTLSILTFVLGGSIIGGITMGLHTEGAKAREVTQANSELVFSKTGSKLTSGQPIRSGHNILIPLFSNGVKPLDAKTLIKTTNGSADGGYSSIVDGVDLPEYTQDEDSGSGFLPLSAKKYRMYVSSVKGDLSPTMRAKYVKFGATGIGALMVTNVPTDTTIRVLLENKDVYKIPGADAPGLTVDGKPVNTKRDVVLMNASLQTSAVSKDKFDYNSSASSLLDITYGNEYMALWHHDDNMLTKTQQLDERKLNELKTNKDSLNAGSHSDSEDAGTDMGSEEDQGQAALDAQKSIIDADKEDRTELDTKLSDYKSYHTSISKSMTMSTNYQIVGGKK